MIDPAVLVMLSAEIEPLSELRDWQPVQDQIDLLLAALRGHDGFTLRDLDRMRCWVQRWEQVPLRLRPWWVRRVIADRTLSAALIDYLDRRPVAPSLRWAASRAWRDDHGIEAYHPLLPGW